MRESAVEKSLVEAVQAEGGRAFKLVSPGAAGIPDRLVLRRVPPEHQALVQRYVKLVEVKAPGAKLRPLQEWLRRDIQSIGHCSEVVDSKEAIRELLS